jgi:ribosomal protein L37AE/L43A
LATEPTPQRAYRAACPNCGAPVEFRSAASAFAVCSFCKSTVVRDGDALRKVGQSAELFDDHTPLRLGASGRYQGAPFTLAGRLQYGYAEGTWNEWHALFDSGPDGQRSGWLSEDNGRYVVAFDAPLAEAAPSAASLRPGAPVVLAGQAWSVASVMSARLIAIEGELPAAPRSRGEFTVVDLRNPRGEVGTLDYSEPARPVWSIGRSVALSELALTGLADANEKSLKGRGLECPNCGAALEVKLATTQSIVCHQCHAVVDVSQGVGGDLSHYVQATGGREPQIPLGSVGQLALFERGGTKPLLPWQVVGYVERCEMAAEEGDEQSFWREYLLYHREEGFAFIVDAEDGWSWTAPITGVPERFGESVKHDGVLFRKLYDYTGRVTYVLGEFYWKLERDQLTYNTDYQGTGGASGKRLNRERTGSAGNEEIVWSAGETLPADAVLQAFRLAPEQRAGLQRDVLPTSSGSSSLLAKAFLAMFVIAVVLMLFRCGGGNDCDDTRATFGEASQEYRSCMANQRSGGVAVVPFRTGGGSFGGYSSGGSHK